jgi:antitoxin component YwqK of YwqJK toxin-antitoxin module
MRIFLTYILLFIGLNSYSQEDKTIRNSERIINVSRDSLFRPFKMDSLYEKYLKLKYDPPLEINEMVLETCQRKVDTSFCGVDSVDIVVSKGFTDSTFSRQHLVAVRYYHKGYKQKVIGYYENNNKYCEINYNGFTKEGLSEFWYLSGNRKRVELWRNGQIVMPIFEFWENGRIKFIDYSLGKAINEDRWDRMGNKLN